MATYEVQDGTSNTWAASGGDSTLTITSMANGVGRAGDKFDLGATHAEIYGFMFSADMSSAPALGELVRLFMAFSQDNTKFSGNVSGTDAAYSDTGQFGHLVELRPLVVDDDTDVQVVIGSFRAIARYVVPVVYNDSGQSFTSTVADNEFVIWPKEGVSS